MSTEYNLYKISQGAFITYTISAKDRRNFCHHIKKDISRSDQDAVPLLWYSQHLDPATFGQKHIRLSQSGTLSAMNACIADYFENDPASQRPPPLFGTAYNSVDDTSFSLRHRKTVYPQGPVWFPSWASSQHVETMKDLFFNHKNPLFFLQFEDDEKYDRARPEECVYHFYDSLVYDMTCFSMAVAAKSKHVLIRTHTPPDYAMTVPLMQFVRMAVDFLVPRIEDLLRSVIQGHRNDANPHFDYPAVSQYCYLLYRAMHHADPETSKTWKERIMSGDDALLREIYSECKALIHVYNECPKNVGERYHKVSTMYPKDHPSRPKWNFYKKKVYQSRGRESSQAMFDKMLAFTKSQSTQDLVRELEN